ncbi:hypothetical protein K1719_029626 [Acacia pycnantha]|nr:hypothetical protein K1719_029626 [Acacia pycnantha]
MAEKSKILIIGATGYIGKFLVEASTKAGHPTFALVRESTVSDPNKSKLIDSFKNSGVTLLYGDLSDHQCLVKAIKQVDVVICTVGGQQVADQMNIIAAIKEAGNIKRFVPSEFGLDMDRHSAVVVQGDGNVKGVYVTEEDVGSYVIKAVDDPRTLNKSLYLRPPANVLTFNEIISLWENKIGHSLEKTYVPGDQLLKNIQESCFPMNLLLAISHSMLVKGEGTNFEIDPSFGVEASELYPKVKYTTIDHYLNQFV